MSTDLVTRPTDLFEECYVDHDGWLVREADGEVIGRPDAPEAFGIDTDDDADFVLRMRSKIEGNRAAELLRKAAVDAMFAAEFARIDAQLRWWDFRFKSQLIEYARRSLRGKDRTARFTWGLVSFRKSKGTNKILDMAAAVAFVEAVRPDLVRVEKSVTVTAVLDALDGSEPTWLESTGPRETATVSTGVGS